MVDMSGYAQWNPATVYILNDIVDYDGVLYISTQAGNVNRQPNTNPTFWAIIGGGGTGGITAIIPGAGITTSGSTAITITNNGVRTLTAGTNITLGGTANNPVINSAVDGVQTITAGTNVSITGTATAPIINAIVPAITPVPYDLLATSSDTVNASGLPNRLYYSSVPYTNGIVNFYFPTYADMLATHGANALVYFWIGDLNVNAGQVVDFQFNIVGTPTNVKWSNSLQGNFSPSNLQNYLSQNATTPYSLPILSLFRGTAYANAVAGVVVYHFDWLGAVN